MKLTEQELTKILIYEQDTECFIRRWLEELWSWLKNNPVRWGSENDQSNLNGLEVRNDC